MTEIIHVTAVEPRPGHRLYLEFEDGAKGEIDFSTREWRGVFAPLADQARFEQVELDKQLGTIVWPNGADMAPESLYLWVTEHRKYVPA